MVAWVTANSNVDLREDMDGLDTTVGSDEAVLEGNKVELPRHSNVVDDNASEGIRGGDGHDPARQISGAWQRKCIGMWCRNSWKF